MPPIKAIIHEATSLRCAATDGARSVVVTVGAGVAKQRKRNSGHEQSCVLCYAIVVSIVKGNYLSIRSLPYHLTFKKLGTQAK